MPFDASTGLLMAALSSLAAAVALAIARQLHLPVKGVEWFGWGIALIAVGGLAIAFRPLVPPVASVLLGQPVMVVGYTLVWGGLRLFCGRPLDWLLMAPPPVLALAAIAWFLFVDPSLIARVAAASAINGVLAGLAAFELLRDRGFALGIARRFTGLVFAVQAAVLLWRAWFMGSTAPETPFLLPTPVSAFIAIWGMFFLVLGSIGLVLMTSERLLDDLRRQASLDPLTGMLNRRAFTAAAERILARLRRADGRATLLMMDIDNFKSINDTFGHGAGDAVLAAFAGQVGACVRETDLACRMGGEEFAVLLPDTGLEGAHSLAERIRAGFAALRVETGSVGLRNTVSIGIAETAEGEPSLEDLLRRADAALYAAKRAGRDRVVAADMPPLHSGAASATLPAGPA